MGELSVRYGVSRARIHQIVRGAPKNKLKDSTRGKTKYYIKTGKIKRTPCVKCGMRAEAHHPDYTKYLLVVWLCRKHHSAVHRGRA